MKKSYVFAAILILLAASAALMIERNSPILSDIYHYEPKPSLQAADAVEAYPVDDWYTVEPTVVFPYEAYPAPVYDVDPGLAYPVPFWGAAPTPAPDPGLAYPAPEPGAYPAPEYGGYPAP